MKMRALVNEIILKHQLDGLLFWWNNCITAP